MKPFSIVVTAVLLSVIAALMTVKFTSPQKMEKTETESVYDRVMRTKTLRCAYIVYPPETIMDPNTKKLSGTVVETIEEIGRQLNLKIEWCKEVGFTDMFEGLNQDKYDALCSGLYETPDRAENALFTSPYNYGVTYAFVRSDDNRFDIGLDQVNQSNVKIAVIDGEFGDLIAKQKFPLASRYSLPQLTDISQVLISVSTNKADVAFIQYAAAKKYLEANPGKLKLLKQYPVQIMPAPLFALKAGENELKYLLDVTMQKLARDGVIEQTLRKYDPELNSYLLISLPYKKP